ncbi:MAG: indolepyruvate oxidoreductase subunit beta [Armatimonadota bacterium]|nr:MAG: indolepyruvate oxidoreductase subunit beta [Armatimonadota bacterium]
MSSATTSIMMAGVGGQGIILASEVLCHALMHAGLDVKKSEVHGMAQRGGSVRTDVRFGDKIYAPLISAGAADILVAFEQLEALRYLHFLRPDGLVLVSAECIAPLTVLTGPHPYPESIPDRVAESGAAVQLVDAPAIAERAGNVRTAGIALMGALSNHIAVPAAAWRKAILSLVPERFRDVNLDAFRRGRRAKPRGLNAP